VYISLIGEEIVIQASYRRDEYNYYFSRKETVYFNIRGDESVIYSNYNGWKTPLLSDHYTER